MAVTHIERLKAEEGPTRRSSVMRLVRRLSSLRVGKSRQIQPTENERSRGFLGSEKRIATPVNLIVPKALQRNDEFTVRSSLMPMNHYEQSRLTQLHAVHKATWGNSFSAPVKKLLETPGTRVLTIGTGSSAWTFDMATDFPEASFTCANIVSVTSENDDPKLVGNMPTNVKFITVDPSDGNLPFEDGEFDYVHVRLVSWALSEWQWIDIVSELVRVMNSGAYIEVQDSDFIWYNNGPLAERFRTKALTDIYLRFRINLNVCMLIPHHLRATKALAGVTREERSIPIGSWGGDLGEMNATAVRWTCMNLKQTINSDMLSDTEYSRLVLDVLAELNENKVYENVYRFWAQKEEKI